MTIRFSQKTILLSMLLLATITHGATAGELGVEDQHLLSCPNRPNCVSTMDTVENHGTVPYRYQKPLYEAKALLIQIFGGFPRTQLVKEEEAYLHFEVRSFLFGYVDDVEFRFENASKTIHFRSAARSGYYDFGVNRKRIEDLREILEGKL